MSDPIADRFSDLIPGKRPTVVSHEPQEEEQGWDDKPIEYMVGGEPKEFFTIAHLSAALGRSAVTIRSWENKGLLPKSPYRSPRPRKSTLPGVPPKGRRLWTREQIEGMLSLAKEERVILNGKPPTKRFAARVSSLFNSLLEKAH